MKSILLAVCLSLGLVGCTQAPPQVHEQVRVDPNWPDSIKAWDLKWQVKVIDGKSWVGMPYEDSQEMRVWLNDVFRYIQDSNSMICYYRIELHEPKCK